MSEETVLDKMRNDWNNRAKNNARWYVATKSDEPTWTMHAKKDVQVLLQGLEGLPFQDMSILDIGCGIGRIDELLAEKFGMVYGIDVSSEMVKLGTQRLKHLPNVHFSNNNGKDLSIFADQSFDIVFSYITFQHCSRKIVYNYIKDVSRVLKEDGIFKFQVYERNWLSSINRCLSKLVHGDFSLTLDPDDLDTWTSRIYSRNEIVKLLETSGLQLTAMKRLRRRKYWYTYTLDHLWVTCKKCAT